MFVVLVFKKIDSAIYSMSKIIIQIQIFVTLFFCLFFSAHVSAQELVSEKQVTVKAKVLDVAKQEIKNIPGTDTTSNFQTLKVKIVEGEDKGKIITVENDYFNLQGGDIFYLTHTINKLDGRDYYSVSEPYRLPVLYFFIGLFIFCVIVFGGIQGLRGIISLIVSLVFIFYILFPGVLHGYSPVLVSVGVSSLIIILGSYVTHGFNKTTTTAVLGMVITVLFTGFLAYIAVHVAHLSGFSSEESVYLNLNTRGAIDFVGLLLGGILIGLLGVLYDAAISQAIAVEELHRAGPHLSRRFILKRALRMGREHIGALVNTLAIAYVGASLPLLLLFYSSQADFSLTMNREIFATEIIRTMVGSIGLILAVPITTAVSVFFIVRNRGDISQKDSENEIRAVEGLSHHH